MVSILIQIVACGGNGQRVIKSSALKEEFSLCVSYEVASQFLSVFTVSIYPCIISRCLRSEHLSITEQADHDQGPTCYSQTPFLWHQLSSNTPHSFCLCLKVYSGVPLRDQKKNKTVFPVKMLSMCQRRCRKETKHLSVTSWGILKVKMNE